MASKMDLSQAVAAGVSAGLSGGGGRKRARDGASSSGSKKAKRTSFISGARVGEYLPARVITRHTYVDGRMLTNGSAAIATWQFRLNSMYDPDYTNTGHQPMGFDQMWPNYGRYLVHKVKVTIMSHFTANDSSTIPTLAFCPLNTSTAIAAPLSVLSEQPRAEEYLLYAGYSPFKISKTYNLWDIAGVSKSTYTGDWDRFGSTVATNPTEEIFLQVSLGSSSAVGTDISSAIVRVRLDFTCEWADRPPIVQS